MFSEDPAIQFLVEEALTLRLRLEERAQEEFVEREQHAHEQVRKALAEAAGGVR